MLLLRNGFFHQDWRLEYASYHEAIVDFTNGASPEQLKSVLDFVVGVLDNDAESFVDNDEPKDVKSGKLHDLRGKVTIQQIKEIGLNEFRIKPEF